MNTHNHRGFTIVEVMLFLAISGMLAVLLLGGWGIMINTQRYKDSTRTLQTFLQQQYNLVYNVENGRSADLDCDPVNGVREVASGEPRGQTDCILMGRYIRISGSNVTVYPVVGSEFNEASQPSDEASILASKPVKVEQDLRLTDVKLTIPWQAEVVGKNGSTDIANYVVAVLRSPLTGRVHTYSLVLPDATQNPALDNALVNSSNEIDDVELCLDAGAPFAGGRRAVVIGAYASSQSFITVLADGDNQCNA